MQEIKIKHFALLLFFIIVSPLKAQVLFEDVTDSVGPFHYGESWGAAWGDFNGDNCPDMAINNHRHRNSLWRGDCQGNFEDVILTFDTERIYVSDIIQDTHGMSFADFDNDGDQDIFSARSSEQGRGQLFVSDGLFADEQGSNYNLNSFTGGRLGAFFDYNNDGQLDIFGARAGYTYLYRNNGVGNDFSRTESSVGIQNECRHNGHVQFANFYTPSAGMDMSCGREGTLPERLYNMSTSTFQNIMNLFPSSPPNGPFLRDTGNVLDTAWADFDNDLDVDLFALRSGLRPSGASRITSSRIESWVSTEQAQGAKGFSFSINGNLTVPIANIARVNNAEKLGRIFVGASGYNPSTFPFTLDPANTSNHGVSSSTSFGYYIGYDPGLQEWTVLLKPSGNESGYIAVEGAGISQPTEINSNVRDEAFTPRLHRKDSNGLFTETYPQGLFVPLNCGSVAHGDFDNDMDIDFYFICRDGVENTANRVFWNDGDGTYTEASNHGAEGPVGAGLDSEVGSAESVAIADYDVDGYLDFFITNGNLLEPQFTGGWDTLIHNTANNSNHWIELDLVGNGTTTNTDGVGATVQLTAGGLTQMREQNGGYHRWSQNHQRIHFGLGPNTTATSITVSWPDGTSDTYPNITADTLYKVNQGGSIDVASVGPVILYPAAQPGDECRSTSLGQQIFDPSRDKAIFLEKNCATGDWTLRATPGGSPTNVSFTGNIDSNQSITNVTAFSFEGNDSVTQPTSSEVEFSLGMANVGVDGIGFRLTNGATTCFTLDTPTDAQIYLGGGYIPATSPFSLETLGPCILPATIDAADVSVSEAAGSVDVEVILTSPASQLVTVDYQTVNGTATSGADYSSVSGTLTFVVNDTSETINIPILQDNTTEGSENFTVVLSNATVALDTSVVTVTIDDDDTSSSNCGEPTIDGATEREVFLWKDCAGDDTWYVWATAGTGPVLTYVGSLSSDQNFSAVAPRSFEPSDVLNSTAGMIDFQMTISSPWYDSFSFQVDPGNTCLTLDTPAGLTVLVGQNKVPVSSPFNIETLGSCGSGLSIADASISEAGGSVDVEVTLSSPASQQVTVAYQSVNGSATSGLDYSSVSGTLIFAVNDTSETISIPILQDSSIENVETFTVQLSNAVNSLITDGVAVVSITDDEANACGEPAIDGATERALFLWQDCSGDDTWYVWATAGSGPVVTYVGDLAAFSNFSAVTPRSFESSDILDSGTPGAIDFQMTVSSPWYDSFSFQVGPGSTCLTLDTAGTSILVGANKVPASSPFDIKTLGACSPTPGNTAPVLTNPGDQTDSFGASVSLNINASDADGDTLTYSASGLPTGLSIDPASGQISGDANTAGVFNASVSVSDGLQSDSVNFVWTVQAIPNQPPVPGAGSNQTIALPASASLAGSASDDGLPNPPGLLTTLWSKVSGPGTVVFGDVSSLATTADFSVAGTYVLQLTADDSDMSVSDDVTITVQPQVLACIDADFESGFQGWSVLSSSTCSTGTFIRGTPNQVVDGGVTTQVGGDHTTGTGNALYTAFNTAVGTVDVDNGECAVQSPDYQVSVASQLSIWYFHGQRDSGDDAIGDYFELEYQVNNGTWTALASVGDVQTNAVWTEETTTVPAGANVRVRARVSDGVGAGDLIEAGLDDLQICPL